MDISRRSVLFGVAAGVLAGCHRIDTLHTITYGLDEDKVEVRLGKSGLRAWFYRRQIFVETSGDPLASALVGLDDLGRELRPGDRVTVIHRVILERSDVAKVLIIAYDVIGVAATIALSVVTAGAGASAAQFVLIDPNKPIIDMTLRDPAEFVREGAAASFDGRWDSPGLRGLQGGDIATFVQLEAGGPLLGPGTTDNFSVIDLWGKRAALGELNRAVIAWIQTASLLYIQTIYRSLLFSLSYQALRPMSRLVSPISVWVTSSRRSLGLSGGTTYKIRFRNDYAPNVTRMLIATRLPQGFTLDSESASPSGESGALQKDGKDEVYWWSFSDVEHQHKGRIVLHCTLDAGQL